ncbi:MAG: MerR family transcriptional regulator [Clostridia bacterium]|nr:MerR family transcriptional regulator [Clostridia bacterium]
MKIKKVCELTGLSDRTIRFYIEQELIEPAFKENYLGRRTYDFSDADVELLKNISVLRKFGFTLVEIKLLILDSNNSINILPKIHERKLYQRDIDAEAFYALSRLDDKREYSLSEIAQHLREQSNLLPPSNDGLESKIKNIISWVLIGVSAFLYLLMSWIWSLEPFIKKVANLVDYRYINFNFSKLLPTIIWFGIALILFVLIIVFRKKLNGFIAKAIPSVLCFSAIMISMNCFSQIEFYSYNENFENYKVYDKESGLAERGFQKNVFPEEPLNYNEDAVYSYKYIKDPQYSYFVAIDLYAEWTVDDAAFDKEVERVLSVYEEFNRVYKDEYYVYEKNGYVCYVFFYDGNINSPSSSRSYFDSENRKYIDVSDQIDIFVADARKNFGYSWYYNCGIFAYNEETKTLRYSYCDGYEDNWRDIDPPYYTQVEW